MVCGQKERKYIYKMNHRSRTSNITVKILQRNKSYQKNGRNSLLLRVLFVHENFTSNTGIKQMMGSSNNSFNLLVHRETRCF